MVAGASTAQPSVIDAALSCLAGLREAQPQVHIITSPVAQDLTANALLAVGAQPSMSIASGEIEAFSERTDSFVANLGMLDDQRRLGLTAALPILHRRGVPWVLDPVKVDRSPARAAFAQSLLPYEPAVIRANRWEMPLVAEHAPDAVHATTGAVDLVVHRSREIRLANGDPLMTQVTAMGCAGTAILAAFLAIEGDPWLAAASALLVIGVAGEIAGEIAEGPGSFRTIWLDQLYLMDEPKLRARARIA